MGNTIFAAQAADDIQTFGRVMPDPDGKALWFNWTAAGFALRFRGSTLRVCLRGMPQEMTAPFLTEHIMMHPVIGVHVDGGELQRFSLDEGEQALCIFDGPEGEHTVVLRKLSENVMGKCALISAETDGAFLPPPKQPKLRIEIAGDSITCGYGNEGTEPGLRTEEENAELTYGFLAAEALGADYSAVCVSGCGICDPSCFPELKNRGMDSLYPFTDAPLDRVLSGEPVTRWDFASHPADAVVLSLGTNDALEISGCGFTEESFHRFRREYRALLESIRRCNGEKSWIVCALGPMEYYLWDEILELVRTYMKDTGDTRVKTLKFGLINKALEGLGADGHPSVSTHRRMGTELADFLRPLLTETGV